MKRLVSLLLCLSLSIFTVARAMKPSHTLATVAKTADEKPTERNADAKTLLNDASKALAAMIKAARADNLSEAEEEVVATEEDTDEELASNDDDSMEDASDDEGEDMSDGDSGDDEGDDNRGDDHGGDDDGGDDGGD